MIGSKVGELLPLSNGLSNFKTVCGMKSFV